MHFDTDVSICQTILELTVTMETILHRTTTHLILHGVLSDTPKIRMLPEKNIMRFFDAVERQNDLVIFLCQSCVNVVCSSATHHHSTALNHSLPS